MASAKGCLSKRAEKERTEKGTHEEHRDVLHRDGGAEKVLLE